MVKGVPTRLHDELQRRASVRDQPLRDYVLGVLRADLELPLMDEWLDEVRCREPDDLGGTDIAIEVHAGREERDAELMRRAGLDPGAARLPRRRP